MGLRKKTIYTILGTDNGQEMPLISFTDQVVASRFLARLNDHLMKKPEAGSTKRWYMRNPLGSSGKVYEYYTMTAGKLLAGSDPKKKYAPTKPTQEKMLEIEQRYGMPFEEWFVKRVEEGYSQEWFGMETGIPRHGIARMLKDLGLKTHGWGCAWKSTGRVCVSRELRERSINNEAIKFRVYRKMKAGLNFERALKQSLGKGVDNGGGENAAKNDIAEKRPQCRDKAVTA